MVMACEQEVIERVELVYSYDPYVNQSEMEGRPIEPVWVFYGRNSQGTQFSLSVSGRCGKHSHSGEVRLLTSLMGELVEGKA
jgi:hypothetical protein